MAWRTICGSTMRRSVCERVKAFGNGQDRTAKSLGEVGAEDEADGQHTGGKRRYVDVAPALRFGNGVDEDLAAVEDEEHQHQFGQPADQRGVDLGRPTSGARLGQLGHRADEAEDTGDGQRQGRHHQRGHQAFQNRRQVPVQHGC
jgi:hypothetical protein